MPYVGAAMKETLRWKNVGPIGVQRSSEDGTLPDDHKPPQQSRTLSQLKTNTKDIGSPRTHDRDRQYLVSAFRAEGDAAAF
jgi:hypothetical protein